MGWIDERHASDPSRTAKSILIRSKIAITLRPSCTTFSQLNPLLLLFLIVDTSDNDIFLNTLGSTDVDSDLVGWRLVSYSIELGATCTLVLVLLKFNVFLPPPKKKNFWRLCQKCVTLLKVFLNYLRHMDPSTVAITSLVFTCQLVILKVKCCLRLHVSSYVRSIGTYPRETLLTVWASLHCLFSEFYHFWLGDKRTSGI